MLNARKNLKCLSAVVLALAGLSFIRVIWDAFFTEFNVESLPEGTTAGVVLAAQIVVCVVGCILLLPQIYVGVKGLKIAEKPDHSKAHIVWATILTVISAIGIIPLVVNIVNAGNVFENVVELIDLATDVAIYVAYISCAKQVLKAA